MLDLLFNSKKSERHIFEIMFIGFFYALVSIAISLWIFPGYSSIAMVFLCILPTIYVLQGILKSEEKKEKDYNSEKSLLENHFKRFLFLFSLFIGFVIAFSLCSFFLTPEKSSVVFEIQKQSVAQINQITGNAVSSGTFFRIFSNNIKVMTFSFILALFYGAGAIFVLAWNASIMGFVIGDISRQTLGLPGLPIVFLKYFIHGIPEMLAYIISAIAGGIFLIAFLKGDLLKKGKTKRIFLDLISLLVISIILLIIAGLLEVYVSPLI